MDPDAAATPDPLSVTCPTCRVGAGASCAGGIAHPTRLLAAKAFARMPTQRAEPTAQEKATRAARLRQRARARDPRMNNDW